MEKPQGITVILIDPEGRVVAHASDFDEGMPAGYSRREAQRMRAQRACATDYVVSSCNGFLSAVIRDGYPSAEGMVSKLVSEHGFRRHFIEHGYDDAAK
jgi:hypothetical protein